MPIFFDDPKKKLGKSFSDKFAITKAVNEGMREMGYHNIEFSGGVMKVMIRPQVEKNQQM
jgi:hypothetical protein